MTQRNDIRTFWAHGTTINDYDQNKTDSQGFFMVLRSSILFGDIIWGGGTEHNTYLS